MIENTKICSTERTLQRQQIILNERERESEREIGV